MPCLGVAVHLFRTFSDPAHFSIAQQRSLTAEAPNEQIQSGGEILAVSPRFPTIRFDSQVYMCLNGPSLLDPDAIINCCTPSAPTWAQSIGFNDWSVILGPTNPVVSDLDNLVFPTGKWRTGNGCQGENLLIQRHARNSRVLPQWIYRRVV